MKIKIGLLISFLLIISAVQFGFLISKSDQVVYFKNKVAEYQLKEQLSSNNINKIWLLNVWGDSAQQDGQIIVVEWDAMHQQLSEIDGSYVFEKHNFHGFVFSLDDKDEVIEVSFYKP